MSKNHDLLLLGTLSDPQKAGNRAGELPSLPTLTDRETGVGFIRGPLCRQQLDPFKFAGYSVPSLSKFAFSKCLNGPL